MASKVFLIKASIDDGAEAISGKARKLFQAGGFSDCFEVNDFTAVKIHAGEHRNNTFIPAECIRGLIQELKKLKTNAFLTDTTTLYVSRRRNAVEHAVVAAEHGFSLENLGIPFIVADGLFGTSQTPVEIDGEIDKEVYIATDITKCQALLSVAHFTGHMMAGIGATLKTLGMGCASKRGKLKQHAALKLSIGNGCKLCSVCLEHCPADAISIDQVKAHIDQDKCIGCAECMAVCRFGAVKCDWGPETEEMQKSIAEHALGAVKSKEAKSVFFNFVMSITKDCDCVGTPNMSKVVDDIGIMASRDPVAVDVAALDLIEGKAGEKFSRLIDKDKINPRCQFEHGERIGLGSRNYELVEIN